MGEVKEERAAEEEKVIIVWPGKILVFLSLGK